MAEIAMKVHKAIISMNAMKAKFCLKSSFLCSYFRRDSQFRQYSQR